MKVTKLTQAISPDFTFSLSQSTPCCFKILLWVICWNNHCGMKQHPIWSSRSWWHANRRNFPSFMRSSSPLGGNSYRGFCVISLAEFTIVGYRLVMNTEVSFWVNFDANYWSSSKLVQGVLLNFISWVKILRLPINYESFVLNSVHSKANWSNAKLAQLPGG